MMYLHQRKRDSIVESLFFEKNEPVTKLCSIFARMILFPEFFHIKCEDFKTGGRRYEIYGYD